MSRRSLRRSFAGALAVALVAGLIAAPGFGASAARREPVRFVRHVDSLQAVAARSAARAAGAVDDGESAVDMELYRMHRAVRKQSPRGGTDVIAGVVDAPRAGGANAVVATPSGFAAWEGLNHFDSRYSGGGNAFSGEPADQGICASNTHVFEIVNSVLQVYTPQGEALIDGTPFFPGTEPIGLTLNEFYGLPPAFDRTNVVFGPFMFDISCIYDPAVGRWFVTSADLEQDPATGAFTGANGTYIAVSESSDPLAGWNIYFLDTESKGLDPDDHPCASFCFGDYPQIGIDANGFYVTTNEFDLLADGAFFGAQLYAFSKADLVAGDTDPTMVWIENVPTDELGDVAYTLQPVNAIPAQRDTRNGGTMYFGFSHSPYYDGPAERMGLYALTNTRSLNWATPNLRLQETAVDTEPYTVGALALQKDGPTPLLDCVNKFKCIGATYPFQPGPLPMAAGNSGKVYGAWLHNGKIFMVTNTLLQGSGAATMNSRTGKWKTLPYNVGIAYFVLQPSGTATLSASLVRDGYVNVRGQNLSYPAVAINGSGRGAIVATLVGPSFYPSAVMIPWNAWQTPGDVVVTGLGKGPWDGFTGTGEGGYRSRWGDYHAAAVAPNGKLWLAAGYINQSCTSAEFNLDTTCGYTRTFYANWSTHITGVTP